MVGVVLLLACRAGPAQPDVVLVIVDTLRGDRVHAAGYARPTTPHLDALAADGALFTRAYSASSWTLPSVGTLLTGLHPWEHGMVHDVKDRSRYGKLSSSVGTVAERMAARGYRTAAFVNNAFLAPAFGLQRGFDRYDYQGARRDGHRAATATVALALEWLREAASPGFAVVHLMEPHTDYMAPAPHRGRFTGGDCGVPVPQGPLTDRWLRREERPTAAQQACVQALYDEEVLAADAAVGQLVAGLRRGTRLVVTADHGEEFWEYGGFEHGQTVRHAGTHVPLLVVGPLSEGRRPTPGPNASVVGGAEVAELLETGSGALADLAVGGQTVQGRVAWSEDTLYTPQELTAVTDRLRLWVLVEEGRGLVLGLDAVGREVRDLSNVAEARAQADPLLEGLRAARGHLGPLGALESVALPTAEEFEQLRSLGYVE